jgi:hypothetical protein
MAKKEILGGAVCLEIAKSTLRTDQKGNRVAQALLEVGVLSVQVTNAQTRDGWNFAMLMGRLIDVIIDPEDLKNSEDLQEFEVWVAKWRELDYTSNYTIHQLYEAYLDLHSDLIKEWIEADKAIAKDLVIARREQLPESALKTEERQELEKADSPLA